MVNGSCSISKSEAGGLKEVIASIKGKNIYSSLNMKLVFASTKSSDTETQGRVTPRSYGCSYA